MKIGNILKKLKDYHSETHEHCLRVGELCKLMGEKNHFSEEKITLLKNSGLLHDVGKLGVPLEILNKNSGLNEGEWKLIEGHPINNLEAGKIKEIILHHHKHQKKSYPPTNGISEELCKLSQIVAVCDMYDALKNKRAYKEKFSREKIRKILKKEFTGDKVYIEQVLSL